MIPPSFLAVPEKNCSLLTLGVRVRVRVVCVFKCASASRPPPNADLSSNANNAPIGLVTYLGLLAKFPSRVLLPNLNSELCAQFVISTTVVAYFCSVVVWVFLLHGVFQAQERRQPPKNIIGR
jgi:hypothetical protein